MLFYNSQIVAILGVLYTPSGAEELTKRAMLPIPNKGKEHMAH